MAIEGTDSDVMCSMDEEQQGAASLLQSFRAAWAAYIIESKQRWEKLIEEQAKHPSLD